MFKNLSILVNSLNNCFDINNIQQSWIANHKTSLAITKNLYNMDKFIIGIKDIWALKKHTSSGYKVFKLSDIRYKKYWKETNKLKYCI